jgi:hypothetical protein
MDKNKLSFYASYVAIACGILILSIRLIDSTVSSTSSVMGLLFVIIGIVGLRRFKNK